MEIEGAIKQRRFEDNYQKAIVNLIYTANWLRDEQLRLLRQYDILPQHFNALRIIRGRHPQPISPGEIKEVLLDKANDLTRLLDKLEKKGYIKRRVCAANRRKVDITMTARGISFTSKVTQALVPLNDEIKARISDKEAARISQLLDKIRD